MGKFRDGAGGASYTPRPIAPYDERDSETSVSIIGTSMSTGQRTERHRSQRGRRQESRAGRSPYLSKRLRTNHSSHSDQIQPIQLDEPPKSKLLMPPKPSLSSCGLLESLLAVGRVLVLFINDGRVAGVSLESRVLRLGLVVSEGHG